ncbi:universal stress protein, partial [Escherichia coli]|nr:universal stress protein [Escherichia coli]
SDEFGADLIIIGSQGKGALERVVLGSVSQKVLTSAACSVRIARGKVDTDPAPIRLLVGFDGSKGAAAAVDSILRRSWPENT